MKILKYFREVNKGGFLPDLIQTENTKIRSGFTQTI